MYQISALNQQPSKAFSNKIGGHVSSMDDLFQRVVCSDDQHAFELIFEATHTVLIGISFRMTKSAESAEEIVDDVFCALWKNRKKINITTSFTPYLIASVRNRSLDHLRKFKNERPSTLEVAHAVASSETIASDLLAYEELNNHIKAAIKSLPTQCRLIFTMSREQELTYKEIADKLGISIKTVDTQMGRALKHIRKGLKAFGI
jgi:RNA polymerase sigma-70 factor (ECF subfamily)